MSKTSDDSLFAQWRGRGEGVGRGWLQLLVSYTILGLYT